MAHDAALTGRGIARRRVQVVVPLSTIPNWDKEFKKWTPFLNTLVYVGDG